MRRITSASIVVISLLGAAWSLQASRRPHYGGTLRIEIQAAEAVPDFQVDEGLVRLDEKGQPRPWLATSWTHDATRHRWIFTPRKNVVLHGGDAWDPPASALGFSDAAAIEDILRDLARPRNADIASGPFRIAAREPGKAITLDANDTYWGGRPYLDRIEIRAGRTAREQAMDFDLGRAEVVELPLAEVRRAQQQGARVVVSQPLRTLALVVESTRPEADRLREALALSIDRPAIRNVLLQRQGETSGALLPQWLTGYAFLFPVEHNLNRARELAAGALPLAFAYDAQSPLLRPIAERIMVNAAEVGLSMHAAGAEKPDVRLTLLRVAVPDAKQALREMASTLGALPVSVTSDDPASLYQAESNLIRTRRVIPLLHLPVAYELAPNVRGWTTDPCDRWNLADVWLDTRP
jgi:peptide/nickel transport system substrate-binding protein